MLCVLFFADASAPLRAQTRPILLIGPWKEGDHWADTFDELLFFRRGSARSGGRRDGVETFYWVSIGKVKFPRDDPDPNFYLGYEILTLDSSSTNGLIEGQLNDVALVAAWKVGKISDEWELSLIGGAGTANDGRWSNEDGIYGAGTIDFSKQTSDNSRLHLGIYYDGNQSTFPDIPLPHIAFRQELLGGLEHIVGLPDTKVVMKPFKDVTIQLAYNFPLEAEAYAAVELFGGLSLFAEYERDLDGFYIDQMDNRRVFLGIDRVTMGLRWITRFFDASIGVGHTLDHSYRVGLDIRDANTRADLTDEFYLTFVLQGTL